LAVAMGVDIAPEFAEQRKVNPVPRRLADVSKARDMLGFSAQISLEQGLSDLVVWWRQEQAQKGVLPWTQKA